METLLATLWSYAFQRRKALSESAVIHPEFLDVKRFYHDDLHAIGLIMLEVKVVFIKISFVYGLAMLEMKEIIFSQTQLFCVY